MEGQRYVVELFDVHTLASGRRQRLAAEGGEVPGPTESAREVGAGVYRSRLLVGCYFSIEKTTSGRRGSSGERGNTPRWALFPSLFPRRGVTSSDSRASRCSHVELFIVQVRRDDRRSDFGPQLSRTFPMRFDELQIGRVLHQPSRLSQDSSVWISHRKPTGGPNCDARTTPCRPHGSHFHHVAFVQWFV
jgi:hypothetical protein